MDVPALILTAFLPMLVAALIVSAPLLILLTRQRFRRMPGEPHTPLDRPLYANKNPPWPVACEPMTTDDLKKLCSGTAPETFPFTREGGTRGRLPVPRYDDPV